MTAAAARVVGTPPSGEQVHLRSGVHHAVIVEVGGGIRAYDVDGRDLLDGYGEDQMCTGGRGQLLVPWPNRLRDGRYTFDGATHQLPISEPERMNAIHGLLRWQSWRVAERGEDRVVMEHTLHPRVGYPFALHMAVAYQLSDAGLTSTVTATNIGDRPCPYGMGAHPYLHVAADTVDVCWLESSAAKSLIADERGIPVDVAGVEATGLDFRRRRQVGAIRLDHAFTEMERDAAGRAWVRLWDEYQARGVGLWMDERYRYCMLFSGDTLPAPQRRRSLAVEPMTCAPNAFASGDGLITLAAGESVISMWGITPLSSAS
jgi:aldose 1-epimerase